MITEMVDALTNVLGEETKRVFEGCHISPTDRLVLGLSRDGRYFDATIEAVGGGFPSWEARHDFVERVPEHRDGKYAGNHEFGATDTTALIIHKIWPIDQIGFRTTDTEVKYKYLLAKFLTELQFAKDVANYKHDGSIPDTPLDYVEHPKPERRLIRAQRAGVFATHDAEMTAYFAEQGCGKTPMAIARMCMEAVRAKKDRRHPALIMVVAPRTVRANWAAEIEKFTTAPGRVVVLRGGQLYRYRQLTEAMINDPDREEHFVCVIASFTSVVNTLDALSMIPWDLTIIDEAHGLKNVYAKRWKQFHRLRDVSKRRIIMTGTPVTNSVLDLYGQLEFLGEGQSGFIEWKAFQRYYRNFEKREGRDVATGYKNLPFLRERLARIAFNITKKEVLPDLPDKVYDIVECGMGKKQIEVYERVRKELVFKIDQMMSDPSRKAQLTAENVLTQLLRLAQITAGMVRWDPPTNDENVEIGPAPVEFFAECPKRDALIEDIKALPANEKALVWASFVPVIDDLSKHFTAHGIKHVILTGRTSDADRAAAVAAFNNDPTVKVFLSNPAAGGEGINLLGHNPSDPNPTTNTTFEAFYAQNWSAVKRAQAEDRAHRYGTKTNVLIRDYVVPGTIDEEIRRRVADYRADAKSMQDLTEILNTIRNTIGQSLLEE